MPPGIDMSVSTRSIGPIDGRSVSAALPFVAFFTVQRAAMLDWDFLVQNLSVVGAWLLTWAYLHAVISVRLSRAMRP